MALFAALAVIAILGIAVNARVAARHQAGAAAAG
jgi:hypothetical protein